MRANAFVAVLICIAVFLAGCSADINSIESDTDFKGAETTVQTNQNDTEQYTQDTEISDVINDTAFGDYVRLIFPVNSSYYSGDRRTGTHLVQQYSPRQNGRDCKLYEKPC